MELRTLFAALVGPTFSDVVGSTGIAPLPNVAYGVGALDFNRDGSTDFYVGKHLDTAVTGKRPNLWISQQGQTFVDQFGSFFPAGVGGDTHGNQWIDFDNDGDFDLFQLRGAEGGTGTGPNSLYVNEGGQFVDRAVQLGLDLPLGRGRDPFWFDWNNDGLLDVLVANDRRPDGQQPSVLMQQQPGGPFLDVTAAAGLNFADLAADSFRVADLNGDSLADVVLLPPSRAPIFFAGKVGGGFARQDGFLPNLTNVYDLVIGDFNGDQRNDVFVARANLAATQVVSVDGNAISAALRHRTNEVGFTFKTSGAVTFEFRKEQIQSGEAAPSKVFLGAGGAHPAALPFTVSSSTPNIAGIMPHTAGAGDGLYVSYNAVDGTWEVRFSDEQTSHLDFFVRSSAAVTDLRTIGLASFDVVPQKGALLIFNPLTGQLVDQTTAAGLAGPVAATSAVGVDFDNDKDLDIYVAAESAVAGLPDQLYVNQGNGTFTVEQVAATSLPFGPHVAHFGDGTKALAADYDNNGYIDVFLNGTKFSTTSTEYNGTPHQLLRNQGAGNHWLKVKLQGSLSNRDAIGAQVLVTSGGTTQLRENYGGKHRLAQNDSVLHFGLGSDAIVSQLTVKWPSGTVQTLTNVAVDQSITIVEAASQPTNLAIASASANQAEGNSGTTPFTFTVTRSGSTTGTTTVNYAVTASGSAPVDAADFGGVLPTGNVIFADGASSSTITVNVSGDLSSEANESFTVTLSNPSGGAQITTSTATGTIQNDDTAPAEGNGLLGQYFNAINQTGLASTRIDPTINFPQDWGSAPAGTSVTPDDQYSVRWTGFVRVPTAGSWTFYTTSDDTVRLTVGNVRIINNWTPHTVTLNSAKITLTAGWHPIKLEYYQNTGVAEITLSYSGPGQAKVIIPTANLSTTDLTPAGVVQSSPVARAAVNDAAATANIVLPESNRIEPTQVPREATPARFNTTTARASLVDVLFAAYGKSEQDEPTQGLRKKSKASWARL